MKAQPTFTPEIARYVGAPVCPSPITGKTYLALAYKSTVPRKVYAAIFADGVESAALGVLDLAAISLRSSYGSNMHWRKWPGSGHIVVFVVEQTGGSFRTEIITLNCDTMAINRNEGFALFGGASTAEDRDLVMTGSTQLAILGSQPGLGPPSTLYPMTAAVGASGSGGAGWNAVLGTALGAPIGYDMSDAADAPMGILISSESVVSMLGDGDGASARGFWPWLNPAPTQTWDAGVNRFDPITDGSPIIGGGCLVVSNTSRVDLWKVPADLDVDGVVSLWPEPWCDAISGAPQSSPDGTQLVLTGDDSGPCLIRTLIQVYADDGCPVPSIPLGNMSGFGGPPHVLFPLD